jgi:kynurenine formamidase
MPRAPRLVDVSHTVEAGMLTYPGLPGPEIRDYLSREESRRRYAIGTEFHIGRIDMVANTGTYLDTPFHRFAAGADLAALPLEAVANLEGIVVRARRRPGRTIGTAVFRDLDLRGRAVLVETGWDAHWRTKKYFDGHPYLTAEAAELLIRAGAALVGIDSLNIDDTADGARPAHTLLLGAGIPIVEHLCGLDRLPERGFRFFAVPVKVRRLGSFPVRAFAIADRAAATVSAAGRRSS